MLRFKTTNLLIHLGGWLLFIIFPLLFLNDEEGKNSWFLITSPYYWLFCITYMGMFYINLWYLIPRFVFKKKFVKYSLLILLLFSCVYYVQPYINLLGHNKKVLQQLKNQSGSENLIQPGFDSATVNRPFGPLPHQDLRMQDPNIQQNNGILELHQSDNIDLVALFIFIIIMGLSLATATIQQWQSTEQRMVLAEADRANAELSFLKAQINPHFLFNTLNNIYTLSLMNSENTSESIMKLSNIMRYVTDDVNNDLVLLKSEVDCIEDYIDLQRLRVGANAEIKFSCNGAIQNQKIGPLILMTFIENAFKYGVSKKEKTVIDINVNVNQNRIDFFCQNKIFEQPQNIERTGIGLQNTVQRLKRLYSNNYQLAINDEQKLFTVKLCINC